MFVIGILFYSGLRTDGCLMRPRHLPDTVGALAFLQRAAVQATSRKQEEVDVTPAHRKILTARNHFRGCSKKAALNLHAKL